MTHNYSASTTTVPLFPPFLLFFRAANAFPIITISSYTLVSTKVYGSVDRKLLWGVLRPFGASRPRCWGSSATFITA